MNLIFYIIITPIIGITLTKIMFFSENGMIIKDVISRFDSILDLKPLNELGHESVLKDFNIELNKVSFSYAGNKNALNEVSMKLKQGTTIALVGPSGSGKTTLASLIPRFFDVNNGFIKIGGVNVKNIPKENLMDSISFFFQNSKLLKQSILENVRLGKPLAN